MNKADNEKYQAEKLQWYIKDSRDGKVISFFAFLLFIGVPMFLMFNSYRNFSKEQSLQKMENQKSILFAKEYLAENSPISKEITLLGTRPSSYKRFQK
jgi:hypothetical protein